MDKIKEHSLLAQNYPGIPATDGAGVKLTRLLGTPELDQIDPFLMLDRIDSDDPDSYIAGFPDHPHRGFETVTFIHDGLMRHRDSVGNEGVLSAGDVQWMTAGKGIIHSEIPEMVNGKLSGFQLWVNLPSTKKMVEPRYQDIVSSEIPENTLENGVERVIAGNHSGILGAAKTHTQVKILDINADKSTQPIRFGLNLGAGAEYNLSGNTSLFFQLNWNYFINNLLTRPENESFLREEISKGVFNAVNAKAFPGNIVLSFGILF